MGGISSLNKPGNRDKVESLVLLVLRSQKWDSSIQVGYYLTFSIEGNALEKVVGWFGNVDSRTESGRTIRISHRDHVRSIVPTILLRVPIQEGT